jgi:hypothetical protein
LSSLWQSAAPARVARMTSAARKPKIVTPQTRAGARAIEMEV